MTDPAPAIRQSMPGPVKWAIGLAFFQVVSNVLVGVLVAAAISDAEEHGEQLATPGLAYFSEYVSFIAAAALVVAAIGMIQGFVWARNLLVVIEVLTAIDGVITLLGGTPSGTLSVVLPLLVCRWLFMPKVRAWFGDEAPGHTGDRLIP